MNRVKKWLAGVLTLAMVLTSVGFSNFGTLTAFARNYDLGAMDGQPIKVAYTGEVIDVANLDAFASLKVKTSDKFLQRGIDFTITTSNSEIGPATAKIVGAGNYATDTFSDLEFEIVAEESEGYVVSVDESKFVYRGFTGSNGFGVNDLRDATVVLLNNTKLQEDNSGAPNTWRAVFTRVSGRIGNTVAFAGDKFRAQIIATDSAGTEIEIFNKVIEIAKKDLASLYEISATDFEGADPTYNAKEQTPVITSFQAKFEADGSFTEFSPSNRYAIWTMVEDGYENNINACTVDDGDCATATIQADATNADNCFTGTAKVKFAINPLEINDTNVKLNAKTVTVTYNGQPQNPDLDIQAYFGTVTAGKEIPAEDYTFEYRDVTEGEYPVAVGDHVVRIVPSENGNLHRDHGVNVTPDKPALTISPESLKKATATLKGAPVPAGTTLTNLKNLYDYFRIVTANGHELALGEFESENMTVAYTSGNGGDYNTEYEVTVTGRGNFTDSFTFKYTTGSRQLAALYTSTATITYDRSIGGARPDAAALGRLTENGTTNTLSASNYVVTDWENWQAAGQAIATIKGKTGTAYEGSSSQVVYTILPFDISGNRFTATVTGISEGIYAQGSKITGATVTIKDNNGTANNTADDKEFTLSSDECEVVADTITGGKMTRVAVNGIGNYTGTKYANVDVVITVADFDNAEVSGEIPAGLANYRDSATIKKYVNVTIDGKVVDSAGFDLDNIKAATSGQALGALGSEIEFKVVPHNNNNASGSKVAKLTVVARDIADLDKMATAFITLRNGSGNNAQTVNPSTYFYDGTEKKPTVRTSVTGSDAAAVTVDVDYTVSYADNINAGWATVTLAGKGNYTGTTTRTFKINKHTVVAGDFEIVDPGLAKRQFKPGAPDDLSSELTIKAAGNYKFVFDKSDYTIELVPNQKITDAGDTVSYKVKFVADSKNYNENEYGIEATITIARKTVTSTNSTITLGADAFVYKSGAAIVDPTYGTPYFTGANDRKHVVIVDGVKLREGRYYDYTVSYEGANKITSEITSASEAQNVVFEFRGNYTGTVKVPFTIAESGIDLSEVFLKAPANAIYNAVIDDTGITPATAIIPTVDDHNPTQNEIPKDAYNIVIADASGENVGTYEFDGNDWVLTSKSYNAGQRGPINAGKYTATVKATSAYGGVTGNSLTYTIQKKQLSKTEFDILADLVEFDDVDYAGKNTKAPVIISHANEKEYYGYSDEELSAGDEFEVVAGSWSTDWNTSATDQSGYVKIQLKADSNYSYAGAPYDAEFDWIPVSAAKLADEVSIKDQIYTGKAIHPTMDDVVIADGSVLDKAWMSIQSYDGDLVNAGKASAFVIIKVDVPDTELRIYSSTIKVPFNIALDEVTAAAEEVSKQLAALAGEKAGLDDKAAVEAARKAYDELPAAAKAKVDPSALANLEAAEKAVEAAQAAADQAAADAVSNAAKALTDASTKEEAAAVVNAYLALTDAQKALVQKDATAVAALKAASEKSGIPIPGMEKKASKITITNKAKKVKRGKKLKITFKKTGDGKVTFKNKSAKKVKKVIKLKGNKIVVTKKAKKGKVYKVKVQAFIAETANYKAAKSKVKVIKIKVK